jgi:phosphomevalonate kinase
MLEPSSDERQRRRENWPRPSTTTTTVQLVSNLVIDLFDSGTKALLWRGLAAQDLSTNANKNTKDLDIDISKMFKSFPPKPGH